MTISDYQWAFSHITKAALQASSTYTITNFSVQTDQVNPGLGWKEPQRKGTLRPRPVRLATNADQSRRPDGTWEGVWCFPPWTPGQFAYVITNQWASGAVWSADATIQTWDDNVNAYSCFQVTIWRPVPGEDFDIIDQMYIDVKVKYTFGVLL